MKSFKITYRPDVCRYGNPLLEYSQETASSLPVHYCDGCYYESLAKARQTDKEKEENANRGAK